MKEREKQDWRKAVRFLVVCGGSGVGLLGQRRDLRMDAELQVDVRGQNVISGRRVVDPRAFYVDLDHRISTTAMVWQDASRRLGMQRDKGVSDYLQHHTGYPEDEAHTLFSCTHMHSNLWLEKGLAQSPAVGGAAVRHPENRRALHQHFGQMLDGCELGPGKPLVAWIVASTAGGTGEGTHRFVGALLAERAARLPGGEDTAVVLNFIRVGQLTYREVNSRRTALNTFFGIAADAAYTRKLYGDFGNTVINFFYVDLPGVGINSNESVELRARLVEMAAKAIMLDELSDDLQSILVNRGGIPMVLVRTGYWGRDFGEQKYYETLKQLRAKLRDLIEPDYEGRYIEGRLPPKVETGDTLGEMVGRAKDAKRVLDRLQAGWRFPKQGRSGSLPGHLSLLDPHLRRWNASMSELLETEVEELGVEFRVDVSASTSDGPERPESVVLTVPTAIEEGEAWFSGVDEAHRTRAWAAFLLGSDPQDGSLRDEEGKLVRELWNQARELSRVFHSPNPFWSSEWRAQRAADLLGDFLFTLVQVNHLVDLEENARRLLERAMLGPRRVLGVADQEFAIYKRAVGTRQQVSIEAAELSKLLDRQRSRTWLQLLDDAVRILNIEQFREEVLRGATGLTESGLRAVLGLPAEAQVADIENLLNSRMGHMLDREGNPHEAHWWASTRVEGTASVKYRILPDVDRALEALLTADLDAKALGYKYQFERMGMIGLYVLAFECVSITQQEGDTVSAPAFLMKPFVPVVRNALSDWQHPPKRHMPSGQRSIVSAGVCGEPLYEPAMREAGLNNDEDIEKISEYYRMFTG